MFPPSALKTIVKMDGGIVEGVKPSFPRSLGVFMREATITGSAHRLRSGSSFGNGSSLSNLLLQPQTLNVTLTPHLPEAALNFLEKHGCHCSVFATYLSDHGSLQSIFKERASMSGQAFAFFNLRDEVVIRKTIA